MTDIDSTSVLDEPGVVHVPAGRGTQVWFSGDVYTVVLTAADTDGSLGVVYASVPPGGGPPNHSHAQHDELFHILDGQLDFSVNGKVFQARRGDVVLIKKGTVHNFHNAGLYPATMLFLYTPGGPEGLFVEGGDTPIPGEQVQPWGPERIDENLVRLLEKYDNVLPAPPAE